VRVGVDVDGVAGMAACTDASKFLAILHQRMAGGHSHSHDDARVESSEAESLVTPHQEMDGCSGVKDLGSGSVGGEAHGCSSSCDVASGADADDGSAEDGEGEVDSSGGAALVQQFLRLQESRVLTYKSFEE
jgi:hypothetical protein